MAQNITATHRLFIQQEQALPIFAKHHFGKSVVEMGVDFIGVNGCCNYLPFLRFALSIGVQMRFGFFNG
jgi:hypothetical protein